MVFKFVIDRYAAPASLVRVFQLEKKTRRRNVEDVEFYLDVAKHGESDQTGAIKCWLMWLSEDPWRCSSAGYNLGICPLSMFSNAVQCI